MVGQKLPSVCRTLLVGILLLLLCVTTSSGLQCYGCNYSKVSDGSILTRFLSAFIASSNDDCKLSRDSDTTNVNIRSCPEPTDDSKVVKCVTHNGTATLYSYIYPAIKFHTLVRDCVEVNQSASEASDGCYQQSDSAPDRTHSIVNEAFSTHSGRKVSFDGKSCYFSEDLATAGGATVTGTKGLSVLTMALILAALN